MFRLTTLSIRPLLLLITFVIALPAAGIILVSGFQYRNAMLDDARRETQKLSDRIAGEQQSLAAGAEQLMTALAQLPDVRKRDAVKVEPVLRELQRLNPMYANIIIADKRGDVWAAAVSTRPAMNVMDRRYFRNALASGKLSSGEYVISRATGKGIYNLAYPLKDIHGAPGGVIAIGFKLDQYRQLLDRMQLPVGSSFVLMDHKGTILFRAINPEAHMGKPYMPDEFRKMMEGPESGTSFRLGFNRDRRIITYRKLRLAGEQTPYMYVTAGIPEETATRAANRALAYNMALLSSFLVLACAGAALIGRHAIVDRFKVLEAAARRLAGGDLQVRVSDLVVGGELGRLGQTFDAMAEQLARREAERLKAEDERHRIEGQLIQAQKMESIGRLAGGMAHDFNNLLTPIIIYTEMLKKSQQNSGTDLTRTENILKAALGAKELVQQLMSFSRKQVLLMETINLNQVITGFRNILRHTIRESIDIRFHLAGEPYCIRADMNQIEQVIMNLTVNAQDAIDAHGVITIETAPVMFDDEYARQFPEMSPGRYLMLSVSDDGCGMDQETRQRIFEPFFTTKGIGKGTGLGLATVYGIVRQHGGTIQVHSEPDKGTTFKCYFPIVDEPTAGEQPAEHEHVPLAGERRTILLAEDNEMVRTLVNDLLTQKGFEVLAAEDPVQALQISENRSIDLLVTDVVMPYMTGPELYSRLLENYPGLKVLYMSGYTNDAVTKQGWQEEAIRFIAKPFAIAEFMRCIEPLLIREEHEEKDA